MTFKKYCGKVFGVELTAAEKKAMDTEINRQLVERDKQYTEDIDAMVLYTLMVHYGWGKKRLKGFWNAFNATHKALREFYLMDAPGENEWLAHRKLKEKGVDVHLWYEEEKE